MSTFDLHLPCVLCNGAFVQANTYRSHHLLDHLESAHGIDGHLTHCVYCATDCEKDAPDHHPDCPAATGIYPVTGSELGARGPDDPYAHGLICMDCEAPFTEGESFTYRQLDDESDIRELVCLGCALLTAEPRP